MNAVDVVIPCYNYGRFLEACVTSVVEGAKRPVRILIVDDASTDETPVIASALASTHPDVHYRRHSANVGHIAGYNEGIAWASSAYFILLSADDLLAPGALDRAASFLDAHPGVGLVYGRTVTFRGDVPAVPAPGPYDGKVIPGRDFIHTIFADSHNPIASPASVMVRTPLQQQVGGYLPELPHAGDLEMYMRLAARADVGVLDADQGLYRKHGSNMSRGFEHLRDYAQRLLAFETICAGCGDVLPDHDQLLQAVTHTMASELFWRVNRAFSEVEHADELNIDECLAFAAAIDPSIQRSRSWRAFRVKRMLGRAWARRAVALVDAFRHLAWAHE